MSNISALFTDIFPDSSSEREIDSHFRKYTMHKLDEPYIKVQKAMYNNGPLNKGVYSSANLCKTFCNFSFHHRSINYMHSAGAEKNLHSISSTH